jgi:hypothetical protein
MLHSPLFRPSFAGQNAEFSIRDETNSQVTQMGMIYKCAYRSVIWLEFTNSSILEAIRLLNTYGDREDLRDPATAYEVLFGSSAIAKEDISHLNTANKLCYLEYWIRL